MRGNERKLDFRDKIVIDEVRGKMYNVRFMDHFAEQKYIFKKNIDEHRIDLSHFDKKQWIRDLQMAHHYINSQYRKATFLNQMYIAGPNEESMMYQ